jgi:hypothetical protein
MNKERVRRRRRIKSGFDDNGGFGDGSAFERVRPSPV